jgi:hypothetical protein
LSGQQLGDRRSDDSPGRKSRNGEREYDDDETTAPRLEANQDETI